jgi:hypothetical protein
MKRTILLFLTAISALTGFAVNISADKLYTMSNRNDNSLYVKDTGDDILKMGTLDNKCYWRFIPTGTDGQYYVQNVATGRYAQECSTATEVNVTMGTKPVAYSIKDCSSAEGTDCFGLTSANEAVLDFTAGAVGWNWKNDNTVQTFASVAGTNHRSFWKITEFDSPFMGSEPAAGDFYLYNVATGKWLGDNDWNTNGTWTSHAELVSRGRDIEFIANGSGWQLNPKLGHNKSINANNLYMDTSEGVTVWTFTKVEGLPYAYTITSGDYQMGGNSEGMTTSTAADVTSGVWQIVSRSERISHDMAVATETSPTDMSWAVLGGTFPVDDQHRSDGTWQGDYGDNNSGGDGFYHCNRVWEMWNITGSKDIYQTISVPNGKYEVSADAVYVSTGGSAMSSVHYDAYTAGTEPTLGKVYANDQSVLMKNAYELVTDASVADHNTKDLGNGKWAYNGTNEFSTNIFDGNCATEKIALNVTDGTLRVGVKVEGGNAAWIIFDNFRVNCLGALTGTDAYIADLNKAIANGEACTTATTTALNNQLNEAITAGKGKLTSTDTDEISAATAAINTVLQAISASATNYDLLSRTVTVCKAECTTADETFQTAITNALNTLETATTNEALGNSLSNLRMNRQLYAVDKQEDVFTGTDLSAVTGTECKAYLYNIGAKRYLTGGVEYCTHAAVNYAAQLATITKVNDGEYRINTNIRQDMDVLNHNGFVDTNSSDTWFISPVEGKTNVYIISQTSGTTTNSLLGYTGPTRRGNYLQVDTDCTGADDPNNQWKLVSKEERDALLKAATKDNPVDATYYIHAAGFDHWLPACTKEFPTQQWQTDCPTERGNHNIGGWEPDFNFETWNDINVKLYQELTGLPQGKYKLSVQGYYRHGTREQQAEEYKAGTEKTDGAALYATNGNDKTFSNYLVPITSELDKVPGYGYTSEVGQFPDDRNETVARYFEAGLYKNSIEVEVTDDGTLTIGVEKFDSSTEKDWVVVDNFRLTYYGPTYTQVEITDAKYATYVADYDLDFTGSGVTAYSAHVENGYVTLEEASAVKKDEPVVLYATAAGKYDINVSDTTPAALAGNELLWSDSSLTSDGTMYILAAPSSSPVGFYKATTGTTLAARKAYLKIGSDAKTLYPIVNEDDAETTAINVVDVATNAKADIYNMQGQKLTTPVKGVNIVDGKKVVVK